MVCTNCQSNTSGLNHQSVKGLCLLWFQMNTGLLRKLLIFDRWGRWHSSKIESIHYILSFETFIAWITCLCCCLWQGVYVSFRTVYIFLFLLVQLAKLHQERKLIPGFGGNPTVIFVLRLTCISECTRLIHNGQICLYVPLFNLRKYLNSDEICIVGIH
jgi:hypothetical protein